MYLSLTYFNLGTFSKSSSFIFIQMFWVILNSFCVSHNKSQRHDNEHFEMHILKCLIGKHYNKLMTKKLCPRKTSVIQAIKKTGIHFILVHGEKYYFNTLVLTAVH